MAGIYSFPSSSSYPIKKIGDSPYPYPYPINAGISRQNGDGFGQYPRGRVYLPSLLISTFFDLSVGVPAGTPTPGVQTTGRSRRSTGRIRRRFDIEGY